MKHLHSGHLYIVLCALIFSTMEVMLKVVHGVFAPLQLTCLRFLFGGILLIPFALRSIRRKGAKLHRKDFGFFALTGFLFVAVSMVIYQLAVSYTKASVVAVIFSCNPIFVTILASFVLHEEIRRNHVIALLLEILAIVIIIDPLHAALDPTGALLAVLAAVVFAVYSVVGKKRTPIYGGITVTCLSILFGAAELLIVILLGHIPAIGAFLSSMGLDLLVNVPIFKGISLEVLPAFLYICAINSAGGFVCHMMAMEKNTAREASLIFFLKPMIAPVFAFIFLHEEITGNMLLGILCFLVGSGISILPGLIEEKRRATK